ncbi:enoyl-CoA hydratase/isomerase family protein [Nocardioides marmorisolisilvae]|nr:enoyl-CoA hydratase-related protein [Nocardioides marmorisolisilvae]
MPVSYAFSDGIARITLDDGDRGNPIHPDSVAALRDAVRRSGTDGARVILLSATGRFFSVGGDIAKFGAAEDISAFVDDLAEDLHRTVSELVRSPAIVVSAVHGMAAGAGFPLAAAADVVLAARSAKFTLGYTKIGFSVDGGTSLLVHSLGLHRALRLALLNDVITADEAYAAGLVARVVEDDQLAATAEAIAVQLASGSATAQAATKQLLRAVAEESPESVLRAESLSIRARAAEPDGREGVRAFLEKRPATF